MAYMPLPQFKQKCKLCKIEWVIMNYKEYPICVKCQMRQIFATEVTEQKYLFLNVDTKLYEQSRFLRNIRDAYQRYEGLTDKQITAFKKTVEDLRNPKKKEIVKTEVKVEDIVLTDNLGPTRRTRKRGRIKTPVKV